ncbi:predicted protein [Naegleria gruberi]|uniref:Predicted protein n=1 Tax=Naegleria gruberi TaxID=5762 RepID=D2VR13_NAEGR|nr:uncharacterized protein NAEGRDRAFT_71422 [Naegleria gruberi]EFC40809.1 predicted protein [Naegleria gruberi]|eukprot:XP_002673553.1 predicted protein [Naegleria gruberi strain NEG-M]
MSEMPLTIPTVSSSSNLLVKKTIELARGKQYLVRNGLRHAIPYFLDFQTGCRDRWVDKKVLDVYRAEFPYFSEQYLMKAFELGRFKINNENLNNLEEKWDKSKTIAHRVHFHEKPIFDRNIPILYDESDLLVVDKPASFPIHPCGRYRKNSLTYILEENGYGTLHVVHRLDHSTSGVLVLAKNKKVSGEIVEMIKTREKAIGKYYLAVVKGKWKGEYEVSGLVKDLNNSFVKCEKKVYCKNHKNGTWSADDELGTFEAITLFSGIVYNKEKDISLIMCKPITGRTHQIRIHLESIGNPIINDFFYNEQFIKELEVQKKTLEESWRVDFSNHQLESTSDISLENSESSTDTSIPTEENPHKRKETSEKNAPKSKKPKPGPFKRSHTNIRPEEETFLQPFETVCISCNAEYTSKNIEEDDTVPLSIHLHSWRYELSDKWTFETAIPEWISEEFTHTSLFDHLHSTRVYLSQQNAQESNNISDTNN